MFFTIAWLSYFLQSMIFLTTGCYLGCAVLVVFITTLCYPGPSWEQIHLFRALCHLCRAVLDREPCWLLMFSYLDGSTYACVFIVVCKNPKKLSVFYSTCGRNIPRSKWSKSYIKKHAAWEWHILVGTMAARDFTDIYTLRLRVYISAKSQTAMV